MGNKTDNTFQNISSDVRASADKVIETLELSGFNIRYDSATRSLKFKKEFKEATVPLLLIERDQWSDIRQVFRAVFLPGPQVENFSAQNEWSRWTKS